MYCIHSIFSVFFGHAQRYVDTLRDVYEGFVIYNFLQLCLASVGYESDIVNWWNRQGNPSIPSSWFWSTCCFGNIPMDAELLRNCKRGVLQFVVVKIVMAIVTFITSAMGVYDEAWVYIFVVYNISFTIALYALMIFYLCCRELLAPFRPVMKCGLLAGMDWFVSCSVARLMLWCVDRPGLSWSRASSSSPFGRGSWCRPA